MKATIDRDGNIRVIDYGLAAALADCGRTSRRRASHVEPVNLPLRFLFHVLRSVCSDDSRLAAFTRRWPCRWRARVFGGPVLGPFERRTDAIQAEVDWIGEHAL
jgi:hypothetical protein